MKKLFRDRDGDIHFGTNAPEEYTECSAGEVKAQLSNLKKRKLWRCNVCDDLHLGNNFPNPCPTCMTPDSYVEIIMKEFVAVADL